MPSLSKHQSNSYVKLLLIGDAKSGKTGSLISLLKAGYKLRILDLDNLLDILAKLIAEQCPDLIDNVEFRTVRDAAKMTAAGPLITAPKAFIEATKMLDKWKYKDDSDSEIDLGVPSEWGPDCILVIDSLSRLCDACYDWCESVIPKGRSGDFDGRAVYGNAQDAIESMLAMLTSSSFECNLIVIAHGMYMDLPDGTTKIFPQGVGQKLSPKIPQYFPNYIRYTNQGGKRTIQLNSDGMIDLANTNPNAFEKKSLPIETGLAEFFSALRDPPTQAQPKPKIVRKA
jgi:hypothetical protein